MATLQKSAPVINQKETEICHNLFELIDKDKNGSIEIDELRIFIEEMGYVPTEKEIFTLLSELDL